MKIGLVLSGGVVRGAAHIGALKVLEREGIVPDLVVGTSVGSLIGAAYAAGHRTEELDALLRELTWGDIVQVRPSRLSLVSVEPLERLLRERLGLGRFSDLKLPFAAVATDLLSGEKTVLREGDVAKAICASSALPGFFPPVDWDSKQLVDGVLVDNFPVDVAQELGADYVIGVDVIPSGRLDHRLETFFAVWQRARYLLIRASQTTAPDCLIAADIEQISLTDFSAIDELIRRGEVAAEAQLPTLRKLRDQGDRQ